MRVLTLSSTFPSVRQPTLGVFVQERIRRLAKRCDVVVVAPVPWFPGNRWIRKERAAVPFLEHRDGLTVYHPRFFSLPRYAKALDAGLYFLSLVPFIAWLRRRFPFELVDAHFVYPDGVAGILIAKLFRCPIVVTLRGSIVRLSRYRLHRPQIRWALRHVDRIMAVSESLRRVAVTLGIEADRVRVIPNGVDTTRFSPMDRDEARRQCGLPVARTILLTVAGLYPGKGQHTVVEILPALLQRCPDLLYVVVGGGRSGELYVRRLQRAVQRGGLEAHVCFTGPRRHEELRAWFAAADLSVLASESEGWPNVVLESLACGTPVVATRVGGVEEIVRDGREGLLVTFGDAGALRDAILRGLDTRWDRDALVRRARSFDWTDAVDAVLDEMTRALKRER